MLKYLAALKTWPHWLILVFLIPAWVLFMSPFSQPPAAASQESNPEEQLMLTILHTNDEHGALIPHSAAVDYHPFRENPSIGGYGRLGAAVAEIRQEKEAAGEPVLLLSGGDFIGGTAYSWLVPLGYAPELRLKQIIGYDAVVIGNHEYDYGPQVLADYLLEAGYPEAHQKTLVLASNTAPPPEHPLAKKGLYRESALLTLDNGLRVGLFGLIGEDAVTVTTANEPVQFTGQHEAARNAVEQLQREGADLIIALTHSGVDEDRALAAAVPGIDVIVGGHCHTALKEPVLENDTVIVQAGAHLQYMGRLELAYDLATGSVRVRNQQNGVPFLKALDHSVASDPVIEEAVQAYTEILNEHIIYRTKGRFEHILDPVAFSDFQIPDYPPLQETPLGNFITDAMRLVTAEKSGHDPDFAIQANGSIRGSIMPGTMAHAFGQISFFDLVELIGLGKGQDGYAGYPLVAVYLTGDEIRQVLELAVLLEEVMGNTFFLQFSGLRYDYNPDNAILLTVPFIDLPLPTTRAVISAERYTGKGRQDLDDDSYVPIEKGDDALYCLVTDSYVASFLPFVGEMVPQLDFVLKDQDGNPVADQDIDQLIVHVDGDELKLWQAVVEYAANQPPGDSDLPEIEPYYALTAGRINPVWTIPLVLWPALMGLALVMIIFYLLLRRRKRRKKAL